MGAKNIATGGGGDGRWYFCLKGIAPPSHFPATIASGAPPRPNHAVFKAELVYVSKSFGGARGPCILGDPQIKGDKIRIGQQVGGNAT